MTNLMDIRHQLTAAAKKKVELGKQFGIHTAELLGFTRNGIKAKGKKIDEMWSK